jgi:hypothetical protein
MHQSYPLILWISGELNQAIAHHRLQGAGECCPIKHQSPCKVGNAWARGRRPGRKLRQDRKLSARQPAGCQVAVIEKSSLPGSLSQGRAVADGKVRW